jgi:putative ABC transport system permease protein
MLHLAYRNLFQNKVRLVVSIGGVTLALLLILVLDAIFTGTERQLTAYLENAGADVLVSQAGVRNLHMASSWLPASIVAEIEAIEGVESATPILYLSNMLVIGEDRHLAYVIGLPPNPAAGRPWDVPEGIDAPGPGEIIIDESVAQESGVGLGDSLQVFSQELAIVGLSKGTVSLVNSIAFISLADFQRLRGNEPVVSFVLVRVPPGQSAQTVTNRIEQATTGVTVQTTTQFANQERQVVRDMSTDLITITNLVGFLIGLAVLALTVYTATLSRRAEYGMLKALGAANGHLYRTVLAQAFLSVGLGFAFGLAATLLLSAALPRLGFNLMLTLSSASLVKVGLVSLVIAGLAAVLPIRQISGLDPCLVFRGK